MEWLLLISWRSFWTLSWLQYHLFHWGYRQKFWIFCFSIKSFIGTVFLFSEEQLFSSMKFCFRLWIYLFTSNSFSYSNRWCTGQLSRPPGISFEQKTSHFILKKLKKNSKVKFVPFFIESPNSITILVKIPREVAPRTWLTLSQLFLTMYYPW